MTNQVRKSANHTNAQDSTGPKSAVGKRRSSQNAITHGLLARTSFLASEDTEEFEAVLRDVLELYEAKTSSETLIAHSIADDLIWLDRCRRTRSQIVKYRKAEQYAEALIHGLDHIDENFGKTNADYAVRQAYKGEESDSDLTRQKHKFTKAMADDIQALTPYLMSGPDTPANDVMNAINDLIKLDRYETARLRLLKRKHSQLIDMVAKRTQK